MAYRSFGNPPKTLVITSRIPIVHQFQKLFSEQLGNTDGIDYLCIQSAYKYVSEYDLVIIDEVHRALSLEYRKVFQNIKAKSLLCLTATLPDDEEYQDFLNSVCPVVYEKHLMEVVEKGILPKFSIYNLSVPMAKSLAGKYRVFDNNFNYANIKLSAMRAKDPILSYKYRNVFDLAKYEQKSSDKELAKACTGYWSSMQMRRMVVYNNTVKIGVAQQIIEKFGPERK